MCVYYIYIYRCVYVCVYDRVSGLLTALPGPKRHRGGSQPHCANIFERNSPLTTIISISIIIRINIITTTTTTTTTITIIITTILRTSTMSWR